MSNPKETFEGSAIYCITPTTEELARKVAAASRPTPVSRYELPARNDDDDDELPSPRVARNDDDDDLDADQDEGPC